MSAVNSPCPKDMSNKPYSRSSYRFLIPAPTITTHPEPQPSFELDESDLYSNNSYSPYIIPTRADPSPVRSSSSSSSSQRSIASRRSEPDMTHSSLPIDVPDWSKILMGEYRKTGGGSGSGYNGYYDDGEEIERFEGDDESGNTGRGRRVTVTVPPHEFLARQAAKSTRVACSVHEGVGRTLKGRDLSRVRNAIWEKTGFQD